MADDLLVQAARVGGTVARRVRSALPTGSSQAGAVNAPASGWLAVTVARDPADVDQSALPGPLAELADQIEVRVSAAPGDKGTELSARLRDRAPRAPAGQRLAGKDAEGELRSALRRAKQLIEVGEVLAVDPAPHGERTPTPGGALLESWTGAADRGGVR